MTIINTSDPTQRINSAMSINSTYGQTASQDLRANLQDKINSEWLYASDLYVIQEETPFASGSLVNTEVRINHAPVSTTGEKLGDDFKELIFKDVNHPRGIGYKYFFDNNWWITTNSDIYRKSTASTSIRRCNNTLRWVDDNGNQFTEPCVIEYKIQANKDYGRATIVIPDGSINIYSQLNTKTRKISPNQRFLFGNVDQWVAYRIFGDGLRNFLNDKTMDNDTTPLLMLSAGANYVNKDVDNIVLGIADYYVAKYTMSTTPSIILGNVGDTFQLSTLVLKDGIPLNKSFNYITSDSSIVSISGSIATLNTVGNASILATMVDNSAVINTIPVTVSASPVTNYEVRVSPTPSFILEGSSKIFNVYLYLDGIVQSDIFTFTVIDTGIPIENYTISQLDGNTFSIKNNKRWMTDNLEVSCVSGANTQVVSLLLKGAW